MENRLDKLFRNQISKHEETPSLKTWEQIHHQLASKRRAFWAKRLAIAASILIIATVGFVGYRSLNDIESKKVPELAKSDLEKNEVEPINKINSSKESDEQKEQLNETETVVPDHRDEQAKIAEVAIVEDEVINNDPVNEEFGGSEPQVAETTMLKNENEMSFPEEAAVASKMEVDILSQQQGNEIAEAIDIDNVNPDLLSTKQNKDYPKVRIIYKANQDSDLVASENQTIINKGINKITNFSEEHLLTKERKSKLRNTKEDLLALNFGKLLNKSSKDIEN